MSDVCSLICVAFRTIKVKDIQLLKMMRTVLSEAFDKFSFFYDTFYSYLKRDILLRERVMCATKFALFFLMKMQLYCQKMVTNELFKVLLIVSYNFCSSFW